MRTSRPPRRIRPRQSIPQFYSALLQSFGRQGWWPVTPLNRTHPVYHPRRSLEILSEREMLEICVGAILTQNTSWSNVEKVLAGLHKRSVMTLSRLTSLPLPELEKLVRSSGYFRQKARRIRNFLRFIRNKFGGRFRTFFSGPMSAVRERLLSLSGIGPETADSMLLYAGGRPIFVVDAYTRRIGARWGILRGTEPYDEVQYLFMTKLPASVSIYAELHALLVKLGKEFCRTAPRCGACPLSVKCPTGRLFRK